jgi:AAA+ superfamily predicted ATPase
MVRSENTWIVKLELELFMLDMFNFDPNHEVILNYLDQQIRAMEIVPPVKTLIPISIGGSPGFLKIAKKSPSSACRLPPFTDPSKYLNLVVKRVTAPRQYSRWQYTPSITEPLLVDDFQIRNAKLLKAYLTDHNIPKMNPLIFMDGPPGSGKSMTIDHTLSELQSKFTILKQVTFTSSYIGETANMIMEVTNEAINSKRTLKRPVIIVLEEADGVFMSRWLQDLSSTSRHHAEEVISTMLQCLDKLALEKDIYIIASTNMDVSDKHIIDPAIFSRIGLRLSFEEPSKEAIEKVTKQICEKRNTSLEAVQMVMSDIVGHRRPSYRDIYTAINRVNLMEKAGIDIPTKDKKMKKEQLSYIQ